MPTNIIIHGLMTAILIGMFYNVWISTRVYGGLIGHAIRLLAVGMLFVTIAVIEKIFLNFGIIHPSVEVSFIQDILTLLGLLFLALGFSKLAAAAKV